MTIQLGLVGIGKIARDQHLPSIARTPGVELAAVASRSATVEGVANFITIEEMLEAAPELDAVALCTPQQVRYRMAKAAISRGKHVLLEKPPGATLSEVQNLVDLAQQQGVTLFAAWHSRFAPAVEPAREWLRKRAVRRVAVEWKEDVRHWHPSQDWIWEPGGLGVFDPGINALSIVTRILPQSVVLDRATLAFPANRQAPIAADLRFSGAGGMAVEAVFDWRQTGPQTWDIHIETDAGRLTLSGGGTRMQLDGQTLVDEREAEYDGLYRRFAELVGKGTSDVDVAPLRHVADAFMLGRREIVEAFHDEAPASGASS